MGGHSASFAYTQGYGNLSKSAMQEDHGDKDDPRTHRRQLLLLSRLLMSSIRAKSCRRSTCCMELQDPR
jgi:hypothetical protein